MFTTEEFADALFDDEAFDAVLAQVQEATGARSFVAGWVGRSGAHQMSRDSGHWGPELIEAYSRDWFDRDLWNQAQFIDWKPNVARDMTHLVSDQAVLASELYNDFFRVHGDDTYRALSVAVGSPWGAGAVAFHRGRTQQPFAPEHLAALQSVERPLARLVETRARFAALEGAAGTLRSGLDRLGHAVFFLSSGGRIVDVNAAAEEVLEAGDPLAAKQGLLTAPHVPVDEMLKAALHRLMSGTGDASEALVLFPRGNVPVTMSLFRLPGSGAPAQIMALLPVSRRSTQASRLTKIFGLTAAEADVALRLAEGSDAREIAAERGTSIGTVRLQLGKIAEKLGCSRQTQIVAIVAAVCAAG